MRHTTFEQDFIIDGGNGMKKKKLRATTTPGAFQTYALLNTKEKEPVTNVDLPSEEQVKEAKDWVDANEK